MRNQIETAIRQQRAWHSFYARRARRRRWRKVWKPVLFNVLFVVLVLVAVAAILKWIPQ